MGKINGATIFERKGQLHLHLGTDAKLTRCYVDLSQNLCLSCSEKPRTFKCKGDKHIFSYSQVPGENITLDDLFCQCGEYQYGDVKQKRRWWKFWQPKWEKGT